MSLSDEIADFGGLVGLLLALVTLLTANRASRLNDLKKAPDLSARDRTLEIAFDIGLAVITAVVFVAGLPLLVRTLRQLHPLAHGGPLRSVFVLAWLLLLPLIGWQISLARGAIDLTPPAQ